MPIIKSEIPIMTFEAILNIACPLADFEQLQMLAYFMKKLKLNMPKERRCLA